MHRYDQSQGVYKSHVGGNIEVHYPQQGDVPDLNPVNGKTVEADATRGE